MSLSSWKSCCAPISQRWLLGTMGLLAQANSYTMRICISLAITQMVLKKSSSESSECPVTGNSTQSTNSEAGTYDWDAELQGRILSSFYWGYIITQIPGGLLAEKYGGKHILGGGLLFTAILTLLTPLVIEWAGHHTATPLIVVRVLMGAGEGPTFPAMNIMLAQWIPPSERSTIGTMAFSGNQIGTIFANSVSGLLLQYSSIGWRSVFYFFGTICVVWFIVFTVVCSSSPDDHPFVSDEEKNYIHNATQDHTRYRKIPPTPWRYILTSSKVWSLVICQVGHDWGLFTIVTDLPLYMNDILHFSIKSNGLLISLPYLVMWIVSLSSSLLADWIINTEKLSRTNVRKLFTTVGSVGPAVFIVGASYFGCNKYGAVTCFVIGMGFMGFYYPGMRVNILDLSPNYSGTLMGIVNGIGAASGIAAPYVVGALTTVSTMYNWRFVFWIVFAVMISTNILFLIFGSGEVQPWNDMELLTRDNRGTDGTNRGTAQTTAAT